MQQQEGEDPNSTHPITGYTGNKPTVHNAGCCLTSLSMAIRFYYPNKTYDGAGMSPNLLADISNKAGGIAMPAQFPQLISKVDELYSTALSGTLIQNAQIDADL